MEEGQTKRARKGRGGANTKKGARKGQRSTKQFVHSILHANLSSGIENNDSTKEMNSKWAI